MLRARKRTGRGFLNTLINKLPVELHIPGYQFCGPGTKLQKRLKRGDTGINELDKACKEHDIAYGIYRGGRERYLADKKLARSAWDRVTSKDAKLGERLSALATAATMRAKTNLTKFGGCLRKKNGKKRSRKKCSKRRNTRKKTGRGFVRGKKQKSKRKTKSFANLVSASKRAMGKKSSGKAFMAALKSANSFQARNKVLQPRIIPIPKSGGVLPLLPIFAGLSALGALSGGISNVVKSISDIRNARKMLNETKRHNLKMEGIPVGRGIYLKPFKRGYGLYLKPFQKNY